MELAAYTASWARQPTSNVPLGRHQHSACNADNTVLYVLRSHIAYGARAPTHVCGDFRPMINIYIKTLNTEAFI